MTLSHIPGRKDVFHMDSTLMTNLLFQFFPRTNNCHQHCLCMHTVFIFPGWTTGSQFTQRTWSSLRGSWSSTPRKCAICFTWSSLWTPIQTSDCLAEVRVSPSHTIFQMLPRSILIVRLHFPVVLRDMTRGRDLEQILTQYTTFVKPAFEEFCLPVSMIVITDCVLIFLVSPNLKTSCPLSDKEVCRCHHSKRSWQYG